MFKITIPKPCHEDWSAMTPNEQGRYCNACAKTVTDFSIMSDEAIKQFFICKKEEEVCGRFKNEQLHRIIINLPGNILYIDMPLWKKFLVACLIVFSSTLFSCDTTINDTPVNENHHSATVLKESSKIDSVKDLYVGGLSLVWDFVPPLNLIIPPNCGTTYGFTVMVSDDSVKGFTYPVIVEDSVKINKLDTVTVPLTQILPDSISIQKPDPVNRKNPPKTDSINCDIKVFY